MNVYYIIIYTCIKINVSSVNLRIQPVSIPKMAHSESKSARNVLKIAHFWHFC